MYYIDLTSLRPNAYKGTAELVHKFEAHKIPDREWVARAYGDSVTNACYNPAFIDRLVFQKSDGEYLVIPATPKNLYLIAEIRSDQTIEQENVVMTNMQEPEDSVSIEMPRYKCHKQVWALKISAIEDPNKVTDGSRVLHFERKQYAPICVTGDWMTRHRPEVGGYYVVYRDGHKSFSPASEFEDGYTELEPW